MQSYIGLIALSGVVVNDSLILVDYINRERGEGVPLAQAVVDGARVRFRPILLTSLTTFLGLAPITILERSLQAQIVIPMAASLAFGIVFATVITLLLIPVLYLILDSAKRWWHEAWDHVLPGRRSPSRHSHAAIETGERDSERPLEV
jgi:multidrug efflux pump subunit AcrB